MKKTKLIFILLTSLLIILSLIVNINIIYTSELIGQHKFIQVDLEDLQNHPLKYLGRRVVGTFIYCSIFEGSTIIPYGKYKTLLNNIDNNFDVNEDSPSEKILDQIDPNYRHFCWFTPSKANESKFYNGNIYVIKAYGVFKYFPSGHLGMWRSEFISEGEGVLQKTTFAEKRGSFLARAKIVSLCLVNSEYRRDVIINHEYIKESFIPSLKNKYTYVKIIVFDRKNSGCLNRIA